MPPKNKHSQQQSSADQSAPLQQAEEQQGNEQGHAPECSSHLSLKAMGQREMKWAAKKSRRTRVQEQRVKKRMLTWKLETNVKYRLWMISNKYLRKLSVQTCESSREEPTRKVSWNDEMEVLVFKKEEKADVIGRAHIRKESLTETENFHAMSRRTLANFVS